MNTNAKNARTELSLLISKDEANQKLQKRINDGILLRDATINNENELNAIKKEYKKWSEYNVELLSKIFNDDKIAIEYKNASGSLSIAPDPIWGDPYPILFKNFINTIDAKLNKLESVLERLELFSESIHSQVTNNDVKNNLNFNNKKVFIVHGHDEEAKQLVARFLEKLDLDPIILHEQPNKGRTVINKFQEYAEVEYAIVILTPDDVGAFKDKKNKLNQRARQNVIFELGFFIGRLGNERVCALKKGDLELPSDYQGVIWVEMDANKAWTINIAKELKAIGFNIDLNKL
jgi:predicted nucleotide-binding protein